MLPGARLGSYEILSALGAGGMGEVYRARDTKLNRDVAIKVLLPGVANDPDRLARFSREAQVLASLNHPNIAHIHGLEESAGVTALILELVEGEDLAQRIGRGPIPLAEALPIARQIADALEAAHDHGIVHRDLKPANIKVRDDGTVKVLDFGLAKAIDPTAGSSATAMNSPTLSIHATEAGIILGTAAYMSPEQARGKAIDKRTDIWAFGCVLFEMLTGSRAFVGDDASDVMASVLARDPDFATLPASTPLSIRRLVRRCLQKQPNERLHDIGDARIEIQDALASGDADATLVTVSATSSRRRERLVWAAALVVMVVAVAVTARRPDTAVSETRVDINTPPSTSPPSVAISPDGRTIAFVATFEHRSRLWLRSLESGSVRAMVNTDGAEYPFWSPDGRSVGFFTESKLMRIDVESGFVQTVANAAAGLGGAWNRDGVILFSGKGTPMFRVPAGGGEPVAIAGLAQQGTIFSPLFLPDDRHFLYYVRGGPEVRGVYVARLDQPLEPRRLVESDTAAVFALPGHLLFTRAGMLVAQRFDPARLELSGTSFPVAEHGFGITNNSSVLQRTVVSVSATGTIAFRTRPTAARRQFMWFDRSGKQLVTIGESVSTALNSPALSLDGQRIALYRGVDGGSPDIWLVEVKRGVFSKFTSDAADDVGPVWSPEGDRIVFSSNRTGIHNLFQKAVAAGGTELLLLSTPQAKFTTDWSSDGRFILFQTQNLKTGNDLSALELNGNGTPFAVVESNAEELGGQFSPDGRWVAYQSDESGRVEVYVQPFPGPASKWLVSTNGGTQVRWRHDGKEMFYVASDGRLMAVSIQADSIERAPDIGTPVALFAPPLGGAVQQGDSRPQYMVSPDGQRFLVAGVMEEVQSPITLILNWSPRAQLK